jgi:hypothetical protein
MLGHCRSRVITVETERDFTMASAPSELQARIRRLFLNRELEIQSKKNCERIRPHLNVQEKSTRSVIRTNAIKTDTWE